MDLVPAATCDGELRRTALRPSSPPTPRAPMAKWIGDAITLPDAPVLAGMVREPVAASRDIGAASPDEPVRSGIVR